MRICFYFLLFSISLCFAQDKVRAISFENLKKTKQLTLEKLLITKEGFPLDSTTIKRDIQFLNRIPSIAKATYRIENGQVIFLIEENFTIIPWLELYQSPNHDLAVGLGIAEFNFLGRNIQLGGYYRHDVFNSFGIQTRAPFLFGRHYGLGFGYFNNNTLEPVFFPNSQAAYSYQNEAFEISGIFQLHQSHQLEIGFKLFSEAYRLLDGDIPQGIPERLDTNKQSYFSTYIFDHINYDYYKLDGFKNTLRLDYIRGDDLFNSEDFSIVLNDLRYYRRISKKINLATRLALGIATNSGSPFAPFEVDNQKNVRGVGNVVDRGTATATLNMEYRYTLFEKDWFVLQGNTFVDSNTIRRSNEDLNALIRAQNIRVNSGFGLRFIHKRIFNAIFRIDYGFALTNSSTSGLVFGIGQYF